MVTLESVGQVDIAPPLDAEEREAFELLTRPSYDAPGLPAAPCGWVVSRDGRALLLTDAEDADDAAAWLRYAVEVLGEAGQHRLTGLVAASRDRDGEMFTVRVTPQHRVFGRVLRRGRRGSALASVISLDQKRRARR